MFKINCKYCDKQISVPESVIALEDICQKSKRFNNYDEYILWCPKCLHDVKIIHYDNDEDHVIYNSEKNQQ